jgi:flagellar assembly protein FliH
MASYSKIFKANDLSIMKDVKVISQPEIYFNHYEDEQMDPSSDIEEEQIFKGNGNIQRLLDEANEQAKAIIDKAEERARAIESSAEQQVNQWWEENQQKLEIMSNDVREQAFQQGFQQGLVEAKAQVEQEYQEKIAQAEQLLQTAYEQKETIISEAEPFLLELSTVIASQIIKQELDTNPEKFIGLIQQHIHRVKEKESITLCVHPDDFEFIQLQRAHLTAIVNGDTEIKVIPDHTVSAKGCIIRTAFGSVDARIDTQIEEIKKVILASRREPESAISS